MSLLVANYLNKVGCIEQVVIIYICRAMIKVFKSSQRRGSLVGRVLDWHAVGHGFESRRGMEIFLVLI